MITAPQAADQNIAFPSYLLVICLNKPLFELRASKGHKEVQNIYVSYMVCLIFSVWLQINRKYIFCWRIFSQSCLVKL